MFLQKKTFLKRYRIKAKSIAFLWCLAIIFGITISFLITRNTISASDSKFSDKLDKIVKATTPVSTPLNSNIPPQTQVSRIKIVIGETQDVPVAAIAINSVTVVSPEIATAQIKSGNILTITGVSFGETIMIVSDSQTRLTYIVEIIGKRAVSKRQNIIKSEQPENERAKISGSYNVQYVQSFNGNPSLLRNNIEFRRNLSKDRTLRVSGETSKLIGGNDRNQAFAQVQNFSLNRISVGIDSPNKTIDFLDSQIKVSPLSLNNFPMRGFYLVKKSKYLSNSATAAKGIEFFAGLARPSLAFYDNEQGKFFGAMLPFAGGTYQFQNLRPGIYTVEIDLATLPANFRLPATTSWEIKVEPLRGFYFDIPIAAQRAVTGIVFADKDGDRKFNPQTDELIEGASIIADNIEAISDNTGGYVLRNLSAGKIKLIARSPLGIESSPVFLELGAEPIIKSEVNLIIQR